MKPVTPASYQKIFEVTSAMISGGLTLEANRGLLVTTTSAGTIT